jgi:hypothetical protein
MQYNSHLFICIILMCVRNKRVTQFTISYNYYLYCCYTVILYCYTVILYCYTVLIKYNKYNFVYIIILTFFIYNVLETTRVTQFTILHNYLYCYFKNYLYCFSKFDTVLTNINTILKIQLHLYNYFHFHNVLES